MTCASNTSKTTSCSTYLGGRMLWSTPGGRATLRPSFIELAVINSPNSSFNILFYTSKTLKEKISLLSKKLHLFLTFMKRQIMPNSIFPSSSIPTKINKSFLKPLINFVKGQLTIF